MFAVQYLLHLIMIEGRQVLPDPVCKKAGYLQGLLVFAHPVGVAQAGQHLVIGIERGPDPVQVEAL